MRNDASYGWDSGAVDSHLIKNMEWAAVTYLTESNYCKGGKQIKMNSSSEYITEYGGAQTSTTGNETGVFDMSGGAWERMAMYVDNGQNALTLNSISIINAEPKYKDVYKPSLSETQENNYYQNFDKYGDSIFELSDGHAGPAIYGEGRYMPYTSNPIGVRGGDYSFGTQARNL